MFPVRVDHQRGGSSHFRHMEIVADAFAVVHRRGLDRARIPAVPHDQVFRRAGDLRHGVEIVVLQVHEVHLIDRRDVDFAAIQQLDPEGPHQGGINAALDKVVAHLFPMQRHRLLLVEVPHHHAAQAFNLVRLEGLNAARVALGEIRELEIGDHIARVQILQAYPCGRATAGR